MVRVPRDGLFEPLVEGSARRPSEQSQFAAVEGVTPVVPRPVGDGAHETGGLAEPLEDGPADVDVAPLVAAADVVDLAGGASLEDHVESLAVVAHEEPVAHVQPVAVEGQRLIIESVRDEQRDQLLGVLVRTEIVRGARDQHGQPVSRVVRVGEAVGRGLACGIGVRRHQGVLLAAGSLRNAAVDLVGGDLEEALDTARPRCLEEGVGAVDVGADEALRIAYRAIDVRLRGEVEHDVGAAFHGQRHVLARGHVAAEETITRVPLEVLQVVRVAGVGQLVEDGDLPLGVTGEGVMGVMGSDEARAARDQHARHGLHPRRAVRVSIFFSRTSWLARNNDSNVPASVHQPSSTSCCRSPRLM